jgi:ketosteroid isomerase-like protein
MHENAVLINRFYEAFARRDADGMAACYAPDATFSDPAFPDLKGDEVGDMWRMLCERATGLRIEHRDVVADDANGRAHWEAWYEFGPRKRAVHNVIDAEFRFAGGRITRHVDTFDFAKWSRQALGPIAWLLGWTPILQRRVQATTRDQLARWRQKHGRPPNPP